MTSVPQNTRLLSSLYRNLLKQSRILDQSPIHRCFLQAKPNKLWIREHDRSMSLKLSSSELDLVEKLLNEQFCGGEYYSPTYLPSQPPRKSLSSVIQDFFRFGIPAQYKQNLSKHLLNNDQEFLINLQMSFYAKKRIASATDLISKLDISQKQSFINAYIIPDQQLLENENENEFIKDKMENNENTNENNENTIKCNRFPLTQRISFSSLHAIDIKDTLSKTTDLDYRVLPIGSLLIAHPMACLAQEDLYRRVIYIIESSAERVVGIVLNMQNFIFNGSRPSSVGSIGTSSYIERKRSTSVGNRRKRHQFRSDSARSPLPFDDCFYGWNGEYNYCGGPVTDQESVFYIMHDNQLLFDQCKESSIVLVEDGDERMFWTWVCAANHERVYNSLKKISKLLSNKQESELNDEMDDEFYDSIVNKESCFKFFAQYAIWTPAQLKIEIENNIWFPVHFTDVSEEMQLLQLKCPTTYLVSACNDESGDKSEWNVSSNKEYSRKFSKWMWQTMLRTLGKNSNSEFYHLSLFPEPSKEVITAHYEYMHEFHQTWIPDLSKTEIEDDLEDDTDEENDILL